MKDGELAALGSSWQIKQKYSNGYAPTQATFNPTTMMLIYLDELNRDICLK